MNNAQVVTSPVQNSLSSYFDYLRTIPKITPEEEHELALKYKNTGDIEYAKILVTSNLRFVVFLARGYRNYGFPFEDIIQEGNVGLMKAVKKFDPDFGVSVISYASYWIKNEIHNYIVNNYKILKIATTKPKRKLFFNLKKYKKDYNFLSEKEIQKISQELNVSVKDVCEMESRLYSNDVSFDFNSDDTEEFESGVFSPSNYLQQENADPSEIIENSNFEQYNSEKLKTALSKLDNRSYDIIKRRWLDKDKGSLQELSEKYNVSFQRISQLEKEAIQKLKLNFV